MNPALQAQVTVSLMLPSMQTPLTSASAEQILQIVHGVAEESTCELKYPALQPQCALLFSLSIRQGPKAFEFRGQAAHLLDRDIDGAGEGALDGAEASEGVFCIIAGAGGRTMADDFAEGVPAAVPPIFPHEHTLPDEVLPQVSLSPSACKTHLSHSVDGIHPLGVLEGATQAGLLESSLPFTKICPAAQRLDTAP